MSEKTQEPITSAVVYVHGPCGRRVADCQCEDGPGQSLEDRVAALEALVVDLAAKQAALDSADKP